MVDVRVWFEKKGDARYISHLDLSRCMQRALKRSGLPIWYTEGFHPHVYVTFALPLSLGQESRCEIMDFRLYEERPLNEVFAALAAAMPPDLPVTRCAFPVQKPKEIASSVYKILLPGQAEARSGAEAFFGRPSVLVTKRTKKGGEKTVELAPHLASAACRVRDEDLEITLTLPAGCGDTINPSLVTGALENELGIETPVRIIRTAVLDQEGRPFDGGN